MYVPWGQSGEDSAQGKVTPPNMTGSDLNYRTERIVFGVAKIPLPYNGIHGRPGAGQVHGSIALYI